jgi:3'-phosphoadenosine 5'-phosphosulfate sulfotransferase
MPFATPATRRALLGAAVLCTLPAALAAQPGTPIRAGQTISGSLSASDAKLDDGSYYDQYVYRGRPGEQVTVTLRSSAFDAYLSLGTMNGGTYSSSATDDDGAGGTDSRASAAVGPGGVLVIRANSLAGGATGAYTVEVQSGGGGGGAEPPPPPGPQRGGTTISAGQTVRGELARTDMRLADNSYADDYTYTGRAGEQIVITLRSTDFDTYLVWGSGTGSSFRADKTDDDGAGGTDSQLTVTLGGAGTYTIRANSLGANSTGAYTLSVERAGGGGGGGGGAQARGGVIRAGETVAGRLEASDPKLTDNSHYDTYVYQGTPGEQILITLTSGDFDTYLRWGRMQGQQFQLLGTDDDAAGGTNSRMQVTVDQSGTYAIQANSLSANVTGNYTLAVERASGAAPSGAQTIAMGQTVQRAAGHLGPQAERQLALRPVRVPRPAGRAGDGDDALQRLRHLHGVGARGGEPLRRHRARRRQRRRHQLAAHRHGGGQRHLRRAGQLAGGRRHRLLHPDGAAGERHGAAAARGPRRRRHRHGRADDHRPAHAADPMLSDSSYYDQYVYRGAPGDRLQITLRSSDFDTYLRWGRLEGTRFEAEVNDDDGGGGTNAQATVTVGGTGVYVIQANAFEPRKTGSYTLAVQRLSAAPAQTAAEERTAGQNKWLYGSTEATTPALRTVGQRIKQAGMMERFTESLNTNRNLPSLPRSVSVRTAQCGNVNAFYSPRQGAVTMCYEMLNHLANIFVRDGQWTQAQAEAVDGAVNFIMYHEVGHALVDVMDLPVTGREEDAVDQLATYILIGSGEKGAQAAFNGVLAVQPGENAVFDNSTSRTSTRWGRSASSTSRAGCTARTRRSTRAS